ncbi:MAG: nucleotidyltransferase domain-containing protein [Chloroflexia bacterium]
MHRATVGARRNAYLSCLREELERLKCALREIGAREVCLFGSGARGKSHWGSELDLLVVLDTELPFVDRLSLLYLALLPRMPVDILAYTPEEFTVLRESNPLVRSVCQKGIRPL